METMAIRTVVNEAMNGKDRYRVDPEPSRTRTGAYYVRHEAHEPPVSRPCPCDFCGHAAMGATFQGPRMAIPPAPLVDALGRVVPEWAREAFVLLSKDGRRVTVRCGPADFPWVQPARNGDALLTMPTYQVCIVKAGGFSTDAVNVNGADWLTAARRALSMEAERLGKAAKPGAGELFGLSAGSGTFANAIQVERERLTAQARQAENEAALRPIRIEDPNAGRIQCLRCGADAGFLGIACNRAGGCRLPEPVEPEWCVKVPAARGETLWQAGGPGPQAVYVHPTKEGAAALWRAAYLASR